MRESRSKALATATYFALRDNAERYHRGEVQHEQFHAVNVALWDRARCAGRATERRVRALLLADLRRGDAGWSAAEVEARKFAAALRGTTARYQCGRMTHGTFRSHMRSLWGTVEARGLLRRVAALVEGTALTGA